MLRLYLIRHGQSVNNAAETPQHHVFDPPLVDMGIKQSEALATHLKNGSDNGALTYGYNIHHIYTSPQLRSLQTAAAIADAIEIRPEIWVKIHELGGVVLQHRRGILNHPGLRRSEISAQFPTFKMPHDISDQGWWIGNGKLESVNNVMVRARVVANDLQIKSRTARDLGVLLVSHGTFLNVLIQTLLQDKTRDYLHYNAGLSRIDIDRGTKASLKYLNYTRHLEQSWIT